MTIPLTSSKDGREHVLRKKGGAPPKHQTKKSGPVPSPVEQKNKSSTSCSNTTKRCPSNLLFVREKSSCLQELFDLFIIRSRSPLRRTESSSLLVKTRQSSSSPKKTNEREESSSTSSSARNELLCPFWVREEIPWQVLYRSISKKQRASSNSTRRKRAPSASWSTLRESRAPGRLGNSQEVRTELL